MQLVRTTARAIFIHFKPTGVITPVLDGGVITFFTLGASQVNDWSDIFFLRCHFSLTWLPQQGSHDFLPKN